MARTSAPVRRLLDRHGATHLAMTGGVVRLNQAVMVFLGLAGSPRRGGSGT